MGRLWFLPLGVLGMAARDSRAQPAAGATMVRVPATATPVEVKMFDNWFKPADITVKAGTTVTFELPNVGKLPHNMHIASSRGVYRESPWISSPEPINGGQTGSLTWEVPLEPGIYKFRCDYHEAEMVGTITVE
ncbi:MAG: cupredoxin domain-containing protein [Dehalococcoidia bacterium]|nr:cupredoxin domain-containing protein [Dehalococcoidia bacterium]